MQNTQYFAAEPIQGTTARPNLEAHANRLEVQCAVPQAYVHISNELVDLLATHTLLTPNERLAREYIRGFDQCQLEQGNQAWRSPHVVPLRRFVVAEYHRRQLHQQRPLVRPAELLKQSYLHAPNQSAHAIEVFLQAWQNVHRYDIDLGDDEFSGGAPAVFKAWMHDVRVALAGVAEQSLPDLLVEAGVVPQRPLLLCGFDQLSKPEARYLDWLRSQIEISHLPDPNSIETIPQVFNFATFQQELTAAFHWARDVIQTEGDAKIGIVVPSLTQNYDRVIRQCGTVLDPLQGSRSKQFDISGGINLMRQPVWQDARQLLLGLQDGFDQSTLSRLACCKHFDLHELGTIVEAWPRAWPKRVSIDTLSAKLAKLASLRNLVEGSEQRGSYSHWLQMMQQMLSTAGWPQLTDLRSHQYQAYLAISQRLITEIDSPENSPGQLRCSDALDLFELSLRQQVHAPQRAHANVQVLGVLETTGLSFTHLWVCELDEDSFPNKNTANAYIPRRVALRYNVPRASQQHELEFAKSLLQQWCRSAPIVRLSYSQNADDTRRQASPLIRQWLPLASEPRELSPHPFFVHNAVRMTHYIDDRGPPTTAGHQRGGARLLQDQAECGFRAFAQHRLALPRANVPSSLPDSLDRGTLLHDCLYRIFSKYPTHTELLQLSNAQITQLCRQALGELSATLPDFFVQHEVIRLTELVFDWLDCEHQRKPFTAIALEQAHQIEIGKLVLQVRLDRIDEVDGQLLVIDYKTGRSNISGVMQAPISATQLPLYSLIQHPSGQSIAGTYFAQVRSGECSFIGVAHPSVEIKAARHQKLSGSWSDQKQIWRDELARLANEFTAGFAQVEPIAGACDYCHLASFCRINEQLAGKDIDGE